MRELSQNERGIIFLDSFESLEYKYKKQIIELYSSPSGIFLDYKPIELFFKQIDKEKLGKTVILGLEDTVYVEESIQRALKGADDVITLYSNGYPELLKNIPTPPLALYARGNVKLLNEKKLGIVGSRKTLPLYSKKVEEISNKLTKNGLVVVSGIAEGADSFAIKGGLETGRVISVFAGEVAKVYPASQNNLANELLKAGGLVISEYPYGRTPKIYSYPIRNRLIAGLSVGSLIASGEEDSGTRYTAYYSMDFGREVFALPYGIGVKSGEICKSLVKNGAFLVETAEEIAEILGFSIKEEESEELILDGNEKVLYALIKDGVVSPDDLAEKSGILVFEIVSALGMMELKGLIVKDGNGNYSATK